MKKILFLLVFALLLSFFHVGKIWQDDLVHVFFCDVGQGDGILISHRFYQVVIDGGPDDKMSACLEKFMPTNDHTLEVVIATHGDSDHITGLISLLQNYQVKEVYTQAYGKKTATWEKFRRAVQTAVKNGAIVLQPIAGQKIQFDPYLSALILNPSHKKGDIRIFTDHFSETQLSAIYDQEAREFNTTNNEAIALFLTIQHIDIAFTSDIESPIELALTHTSLLHQVEVLKAGHHGSKTSNSSPFLNILRPEAAVVSVGRKNRYGHPSPDVMTAFQQRGMQVFRTDQMGTVEMITDGQRYEWKVHP